MTSNTRQRMPLIDAFKGVACLLIVTHHLAFYGPMSDVALPLAPQLMSWLYDYGRMAVQLFLVMAGFLTAGQLQKLYQTERSVPVLSLVWQRYLRLAIPYVVALAVSMVVAAGVRPWLDHESVPSAPDLWRVVSHVFLLHDWLDQEALSAGVWYVAIDFQLYALSVLLFWGAQRLTGLSGAVSRETHAVWMVSLTAVLMLASLLFFNRDADFNHTGLYFFGSYALGMLVRWSSRQRRPWAWLVCLAMAVVFALFLDFRARIAVALATAMVLGVVMVRGHWGWVDHPWLAWLGRISYSVFLIHFPVCLVINAIWQQYFPTGAWVNLAGMGVALALSVACGHLFWAWVERSGSARVMGWLVPSRT